MKCSCCGEDRIKVATLKCSGDVAVCRECIGWLAQQVGVLDVTPTLPVADMGAAVQLCERAGFEVHRYNDGFAFVHWNGQSMFDLDLIEDLDVEANHAGCYISLPDLDGWHARFRAAGLAVTPLED
eukprot:gene24836-45729_t